jgi:hypothetical protein
MTAAEAERHHPRRSRRLAACLASAFAGLALAASAAGAGSASDEYSLNIPRAGHARPDAAAVSRPGQLPPSIRHRLRGSEGGFLRAVATARGLGAPAAERRSSVSPTGGTSGGIGAGDPATIALATTLALIATAGAITATRRRRLGSGAV